MRLDHLLTLVEYVRVISLFSALIIGSQLFYPIFEGLPREFFQGLSVRCPFEAVFNVLAFRIDVSYFRYPKPTLNDFVAVLSERRKDRFRLSVAFCVFAITKSGVHTVFHLGILVYNLVGIVETALIKMAVVITGVMHGLNYCIYFYAHNGADTSH